MTLGGAESKDPRDVSLTKVWQGVLSSTSVSYFKYRENALIQRECGTHPVDVSTAAFLLRRSALLNMTGFWVAERLDHFQFTSLRGAESGMLGSSLEYLCSYFKYPENALIQSECGTHPVDVSAAAVLLRRSALLNMTGFWGGGALRSFFSSHHSVGRSRVCQRVLLSTSGSCEISSIERMP
jgi:hypothetical protein